MNGDLVKKILVEKILPDITNLTELGIYSTMKSIE